MHCWLLRWASRDGNGAGPPNVGCFGSSLSKKLGAEGCREGGVSFIRVLAH